MADASTLGDEQSIAQSFALPRLPRVTNAGEEIEQICISELKGGDSLFPGFPQKCLPIVKLFAGNHCCVDCGDQNDALEYGSVAYGTLLCADCACRHTVNTAEQSDIKSLTNDHWNLHSILSLFEGGNTKMLNFIKDKPRWRPKKNQMSGDSEDVLAFKQIYLSKAATAYRTNLANKVELLYQSRMNALRKEHFLREQQVIRRKIRNQNPFIHVFEMNGVSPNDIPEINSSTNIGFRKYVARSQVDVKKEDDPSSPTGYTADPAQLDLIKERINLRRSMGPSTANEFTRRLTNSSDANSNARPSIHALRKIHTESSRRRSSDLLVGEVGNDLIQGLDEYAQFPNDGSEDYHTDKPKIRDFWLHNQEEQAPRPAARSTATLGTYRRLSVERRGSSGGTIGKNARLSGQGAPRRPQFRPPPID